MKKVLAAVLMGLTLTACNENKQTTNEKDMNTTLNLTQEWDKTFPKSDKVDHKKVTFKNRYGIELAADMYIPKAPLSSPEGDTIVGKSNEAPSGAVGGGFSCYRCRGAVRSREGADERSLCTAHGRTWIPDHRLRPLVHWRERWRTATHGIARHQHRGLPRCCRFPEQSGERGC